MYPLVIGDVPQELKFRIKMFVTYSLNFFTKARICFSAELVQNDVPDGVEDDDETSSAPVQKKTIQKGKQAKVHHLDCTLNNATSISCLKNSTLTLNFKS